MATFGEQSQISVPRTQFIGPRRPGDSGYVPPRIVGRGTRRAEQDFVRQTQAGDLLQKGGYDPAAVGLPLNPLDQMQRVFQMLQGFGLGGGGSSGQGGSPQAPMNVQTSIQERDVFSPDLTNRAVSQGIADADVAGNMAFIKKGLDRPGVSRSAGTAAAAIPLAARARTQAAEAGSLIPYADALENARMRLRSQMSRETEGDTLAALGGTQQDMLLGHQQRLTLPLLQMLLQGMG